MNRLNVSFSGSGFLGMYHVGAMAYLRKLNQSGKLEINHALGSSSGSIVATALILEVDPGIVKEKVYEISKLARNLSFGPFNPKFNVNEILKRDLDDILPSDAHIKASEKLTIGLTTMKFKSLLISNYKSKEELIDCVICSCYLPGFSSYKIPKFRGINHLDGGFTNNLPTLPNEKTVTISPFSGGSDVGPFDNDPKSWKITRPGGEVINLSQKNIVRFVNAFLPLSKEKLDKLYFEGYQDTQIFIEKLIN